MERAVVVSKFEAPFAYHGLDRVFHEKARLGIVSSLIGHADGLAFSDLKSLCDLTDGNLSRHLQVLQEAGYIDIEKGFDGKRPFTRCRLSRKGRVRFAEYLAVLEQVLRTAAFARESDTDRASDLMQQSI
jgi:DNA-binding transcriptional ArsR family regulator